MSKASLSARLAGLGRYPKTAFVVLLAAMWLAASGVIDIRPKPATVADTLGPLQAKAIDIVIEANKLIISVASLLIGGVGALLVRKKDDRFTSQSSRAPSSAWQPPRLPHSNRNRCLHQT